MVFFWDVNERKVDFEYYNEKLKGVVKKDQKKAKCKFGFLIKFSLDFQ
jgi:hypothetical protein